jgi:hypothetical protein
MSAAALPLHLEREARIAAQLAARAARRAAGPDTTPRCEVAGCSSYLHRAGRCASHWRPLRDLLAGMAGEGYGLTTTRRLFSDAMTTTAMSATEWEGLADLEGAERAEVLDRCADALYSAGWFIAAGPRGGRSLRRRTN